MTLVTLSLWLGLVSSLITIAQGLRALWRWWK
jgi:hypothetical protein